jgi:hypothetical protein
MPVSRIYTPPLVKIMQTAEYIHQTLAPRDCTLLATEMRIMGPCIDELKILVQSLYYVYECVDFQKFSASGHGIPLRAVTRRCKYVISRAMLSAGVLDRMLTVCTQHPTQYKFLYQFFDILAKSSLSIQHTFFAVQNNMSVLQELTLDAITHARKTPSFTCITYKYAALMDSLYVGKKEWDRQADLMESRFMDEEEWHRRPPEHGEVDVAVAMLTVVYKIGFLSNSIHAWILCRTVILYMKNSTLLALHRLGWIDKLCHSVYRDEDIFQRFLVRFIAVLSHQATVSEEDRAWIQAHPPSAEGYLSE